MYVVRDELPGGGRSGIGDDADDVSDSFLATVGAYNVTIQGEKEGNVLSAQDIIDLQERSEVVGRLKEKVQKKQTLTKKDTLFKEFFRYRNDFLINRSILVKKMGPGQASAVIGFKQVVSVCVITHRNMAHIGRDKLLDLVSRHVWHS